MEKNFGEIFKNLTTDERDELRYEIARRCNLEPMTIKAWADGLRRPRRRSLEKTFDVLYEKGLITRDCEIKFKD